MPLKFELEINSVATCIYKQEKRTQISPSPSIYGGPPVSRTQHQRIMSPLL